VADKPQEIAYTSLSHDQRQAWDKIMKAVKGRFTVGTAERLFYLSGEAGTGKSYLIRELRKHLQGRMALMAPTGIAAQNIGGVTLHRFLGIHPIMLFVQDGEGHDTDVVRCNRDFLDDKMRDVALVVVDEVSMLSAGYFDITIQLLRKYRPVLLYVGDFMQLPPVPDYDKAEEFAWKAWQSRHWQNVQRLHLSTQHRQSEDTEFLHMLNHLRRGDITPALKQMMAERTYCYLPDYAPAVLAYKREVRAINEERLEALGKQIYTTRADVTEKSDKVRDADAEISKGRIPLTIRFAIGARVVMLTNSKKWVNGSLGTITGMDATSQQITIQLDRGNTQVHCPKAAHEIVDSKGKTLVEYKQFPFQLAWALTIHKCQGMTLDKVGIELYGHFAPGMTYVAISRCRTREGLFFTGQIDEVLVDHAALEKFETQEIT
jgi:ATP-dependent exoDNAse (exonuclease V) alpha subunit